MARTASRTTPNLGSQPLRGADFERAYSSVVLGEDVRDRRRGFTIVELLIVVVVIAILAAITIVAYNGITNRANDSATISTAKQIEKQAILNEAESGQILIGEPSALSAGTRAEFLSSQGLSALSEKIYVSGYILSESGDTYYPVDFDIDKPGFIRSSTNGSETVYTYDKSRVYIYVERYYSGYWPDWPAGEMQRELATRLSISRWSNQAGDWETVSLVRREKSQSYEQRETSRDCAPAGQQCEDGGIEN